MSPHRAELVRLVQQHRWTRGVELGVDKGILFEQLLAACPDLQLIGVDVCPVPHRKARCEAIVEQYATRARLMVMTTHEASQLAPDQAADFVFIDADHSHAAVADDIACWRSKVRPGGWLGGHDYNRKFPGVISAVDAAFGARVQRYVGSIWGVWL